MLSLRLVVHQTLRLVQECALQDIWSWSSGEQCGGHDFQDSSAPVHYWPTPLWKTTPAFHGKETQVSSSQGNLVSVCRTATPPTMAAWL